MAKGPTDGGAIDDMRLPRGGPRIRGGSTVPGAEMKLVLTGPAAPSVARE